MSNFDLMVVGGGPGGYVAAIRAAQLGFKTALVEKSDLGGVCLNWGCIPTKALLRGADMAQSLKHAAHFGFDIGTPTLDLAKLVGHSRNTAKRLSQGIEFLMKKHNITVLAGEARLVDTFTLEINNGTECSRYKADHIILATGAHARDLPDIHVDGDKIWGAREAMTPTKLPQRLLVIGAGAIGVEFASLYNDLGSQVTLIEAASRIVPVEDQEVSTQLEKSFRQRGIAVHTATTVQAIQLSDDEVTATLTDHSGNHTQAFDRVIVAVGISGNIEQLGLETLGVHTQRGFISTDEFSKTNVVGLYAIGDVSGPPWLAHKASHEAVICVEKIAGLGAVKPLQKNRVPGCTYCRPQIASVGLTEKAARDNGLDVRIGRFNLSGNGKALAIDEASGFVKTVFDAHSGELLGAHMIGAEVTEQIQGFCIAQQLEATEQELAHTIFPHPTLSESMHESVLDSLNIAIHH
ncbi:dihydrolipoyl dehydrogenase [Aestuariicella hydrocarbonica]|uniref:Dihydrolipoyl dehydrogenase n=1 Tax=Pseudomaricurvus hydrocarbonicus TaxID=1470433 RepID=A0A9E5K126_9GAMM|nr:dihydrolipoyl dehydrogenase [Aestuariicella hydrocarbonica]NHO66827.1 dihydrolipoyl dehydrogenase [Aestuariicella hydrocarbonica]